MTLTETLLTVAAFLFGFAATTGCGGVYLLFRRVRALEASLEVTDGTVYGDEFAEGLSCCTDRLCEETEGLKQGVESLALTTDEIKGRLVLEPTAKKQIAELRQSLAELSAKQLPVHASHELLTALERKIDDATRAINIVLGGLATASDFVVRQCEASEQVPVDPDSETETNIEFVANPCRKTVCRAGFVPDDEKAGFEAEDFPSGPESEPIAPEIQGRVEAILEKRGFVPSAYEAGQ